MTIQEMQQHLQAIKQNHVNNNDSNWITKVNTSPTVVKAYPMKWDTMTSIEKANYITKEWQFDSDSSKKIVVDFIKSLVDMPLSEVKGIDTSEQVRDFIYEMY